MDQQDWTRIMDGWGEADHVKWTQIIHEWNERLRKERYSRGSRINELEAQVAKLRHLKEEYRLSWNAAEDRVLELERELDTVRRILAPLANPQQSGWAFGLSRSETLAEIQRVARTIVEREYLT